MSKYTVIRDTKEKVGFWEFGESARCAGTIQKGLKTGDYTLVGLEDILSIERKRSTGELAMNITEDRFERELERLESFPYAFMIFEFDWFAMNSFPLYSGIPKKLWPKLRITPQFLVKRYVEIDLKYKTKIILAGSGEAQERAELIFNNLATKYKL